MDLIGIIYSKAKKQGIKKIDIHFGSDMEKYASYIFYTGLKDGKRTLIGREPIRTKLPEGMLLNRVKKACFFFKNRHCSGSVYYGSQRWKIYSLIRWFDKEDNYHKKYLLEDG